MRTMIVFNHPYEGSFCNAILKDVKNSIAKSGYEIDVIHLDHDNFNLTMSADDLLAFRNKKIIDPKAIEYAERMKAADHVVFILPIWWELMPALMKGFIDKVIFPGTFSTIQNQVMA